MAQGSQGHHACRPLQHLLRQSPYIHTCSSSLGVAVFSEHEADGCKGQAGKDKFTSLSQRFLKPPGNSMFIVTAFLLQPSNPQPGESRSAFEGNFRQRCLSGFPWADGPELTGQPGSIQVGPTGKNGHSSHSILWRLVFQVVVGALNFTHA